MYKRYSLIALLSLCVAFVGCGKDNQDLSELPAFCKQEKGKLYLKQGSLRMEIMPDVAGRVSSLKYDGHEILVPIVDFDKNTDWGTVLWSSPQAEWQWPPIDVLDSKPYKLSVKGDRVT
ncbi:MAG TPA: DUF4380 domain-containing protein, partial [Cellvibrio sp.]